MRRLKVAVLCSDALHQRRCNHRTDFVALRLYGVYHHKRWRMLYAFVCAMQLGVVTVFEESATCRRSTHANEGSGCRVAGGCNHRVMSALNLCCLVVFAADLIIVSVSLACFPALHQMRADCARIG